MKFLTACLTLALCATLLAACGSPKVYLMRDASAPMHEYTLSGQAREKILLVSIRGLISTSPRSGLLRDNPSVIREVVAQLDAAAFDPDVRAVLFAIDSPGGTTTASDILNHEITAFERRTGKKTAALLMNVAASGGYYAAVSCDRIIAHPTSLTGSVGTIFISPKFYGLMDKIGVQAEVAKSGTDKDMGSPFRASTAEERQILQGVIDDLNKRFLDVVTAARHPTPGQLTEIATARVFTANQALKLGLIDRIGYIEDAEDTLRTLAGLPANTKLVAYRRAEYADDNPYNNVESSSEAGPSLLGLRELLPSAALSPGFHYLYLPAGQ